MLLSAFNIAFAHVAVCLESWQTLLGASAASGVGHNKASNLATDNTEYTEYT